MLLLPLTGCGGAVVTADDAANTVTIVTSKPYANLPGQLAHPTMAILDDAGIVDTDGDGIRELDGENINLRYVSYENRLLNDFSDAHIQYLTEIGIGCTADYGSSDDQWSKLAAGEYDLNNNNWTTVGTGDPLAYMANWASESTYCAYSNPEYDALYSALKGEMDPDKRAELVFQMQQILIDDAAVLIDGYYNSSMIYSKNVGHAHIHTADYYWLSTEITPADSSHSSLIRGITFLGCAMPNFWVGLLLMLLLCVRFRVFPVISSAGDFKSLFLPALTLAIAMAAKYTRQVRTVVLEELSQDYVIGAEARGIKRSRIIWANVFPNALLPLITMLGLSVGSLLGGTSVVEVIFSYPGLGNLAVSAITSCDYNLIQGYVLWMSLIYMVINLIVDASYVYIDPRMRLKE